MIKLLTSSKEKEVKLRRIQSSVQLCTMIGAASDKLEIVRVGMQFLAFGLDGYTKQLYVNQRATAMLQRSHKPIQISVYGPAVLFDAEDI